MYFQENPGTDSSAAHFPPGTTPTPLTRPGSAFSVRKDLTTAPSATSSDLTSSPTTKTTPCAIFQGTKKIFRTPRREEVETKEVFDRITWWNTSKKCRRRYTYLKLFSFCLEVNLWRESPYLYFSFPGSQHFKYMLRQHQKKLNVHLMLSISLEIN